MLGDMGAVVGTVKGASMKTIVKDEPNRITFDNGASEWFHLTREGEVIIADSFGYVALDEEAIEHLKLWLARKPNGGKR